jgi:cyclopropane-fatty-acyl-phospholipid synthase
MRSLQGRTVFVIGAASEIGPGALRFAWGLRIMIFASKARRRFLDRLIRVGNLEVTTSGGKVLRFGDGSGPFVAVRMTDAVAEWRFLANAELAFGELFMEKRLVVTSGTVYDALLVGARNFVLPGKPAWFEMLERFRIATTRFRHRNTLTRARRNVAHHYDIDGRIYDLFLDSDKQYSCAYFESPNDTLETAQLAKMRHIAAKMLIEPGHSALDIGCGWGGLAVYLAQRCGARVTGVTLSEEQLAAAKQRAAGLGPASQVEFLLKDYRDVRATFDRVVSIGMLEHVGRGYYDEYFKAVAAALKPDGVALIHTIGNTGRPLPTNPWILKYIFPGGYVPNLSELTPSIERAGLIVSDIEILKLHYAETLRCWRERFMARRAEAEAIFDERFCLMWEFYLSLAEAAFRVGVNVVFHFQLVKRVDAVPMTRGYIGRREDDLRPPRVVSGAATD